jgi:hypothetical protein
VSDACAGFEGTAAVCGCPPWRFAIPDTADQSDFWRWPAHALTPEVATKPGINQRSRGKGHFRDGCQGLLAAIPGSFSTSAC